MDLKAIKITTFAGNITAISFIAIDFGQRDANIVANWDGKGVNRITGILTDVALTVPEARPESDIFHINQPSTYGMIRLNEHGSFP